MIDFLVVSDPTFFAQVSLKANTGGQSLLQFAAGRDFLGQNKARHVGALLDHG